MVALQTMKLLPERQLGCGQGEESLGNTLLKEGLC